MRCEIVEAVPCLVHEGVHIVGHADGIHEDERPTAERQIRAIAAGCFPGTALEVQQLLVGHERELLPQLTIDP